MTLALQEATVAEVTALPMFVAPFLTWKVTVPSLTVPPLEVTNAVSVTFCAKEL